MLVKKGFTLSEVLITLTIIGICVAIVTPIIINITPDQNIVSFRKAYSSTSQIVSALVNDDDVYPLCRHYMLSGVDYPLGFNNDSSYISVIKSSSIVDVSTPSNPVSSCTGGDAPPANTNKFCYFFSQRLKVSGPVTCTQATSGSGDPTTATTGKFTTQDGMIWYIALPVPQFPLNITDYTTRIIVDVNGTKGPNCSFVALSYGTDTWPACDSTKTWPTKTNGKAPDIYDIGVRYDGDLQVNPADDAATKILSKPANNTTSKTLN